MTQVHKCGQCDLSFHSEADYLAHLCQKSGYNPTQIEHQDILTGGIFSKQAESALDRGAKRKKSK